MNNLIISYDGGQLILEGNDIFTGDDFKNATKHLIPWQNFYGLHNGRLVNESSVLEHGIVHVVPRLLGGKGGFGSMLRAIGAQIEKTTNREACRDLSGRRLRDINEEKRLKKWISEKADREREAVEKKKKKLEKLASEPKHEFKDDDYDKARSELVEKVHNAVEEGIKVASSSDQPEPSCSSQGVKRKLDDKKGNKGFLWIDDELGSDLSDSDEDVASCSDKKLKNA